MDGCGLCDQSLFGSAGMLPSPACPASFPSAFSRAASPSTFTATSEPAACLQPPTPHAPHMLLVGGHTPAAAVGVTTQSPRACAAAAIYGITRPRSPPVQRNTRRQQQQQLPAALPSSPVSSTLLASMGADHQHHPPAHDEAGGAGLPSLLITCALMFLAAYGCGMLPRWLPSQQRVTSAVSAVGAGLLLGSALCIILPEGFEAAYEGASHPPGWAVSATLLAGFWVMLLLDSVSHWLPAAAAAAAGGVGPHSYSLQHSSNDVQAEEGAGGPLPCREQQAVGFEGRHFPQAGRGGRGDPGSSSDEHTVLLSDYARAAGAQGEAGAPGVLQAQQQQLGSRRPGGSPIKRAGAARPGSAGLPGGAVPGTAAAAAAGAPSVGDASDAAKAAAPPVGSGWRAASWAGTGGTGGGSSSMLAQAARLSAGGSSSSGAAHTAAAAASGFDGVSSRPSPVGLAGPEPGGLGGSGGPWWRPWLLDPTHHALLGLLVHSVSDGLAVGAASLSSVPEVSLGVAAAMVVHKGPVAVGLSSFLQGAAWSPAQVHRGLLLFAAASPLAAVLTYGLLSWLPGVTDNIPLVVLFSGGTVLYAACVHILPGAMAHAAPSSSSKEQHMHQHSGGGSSSSPVWLVSLGMLAPLVLSAVFGGHHHHH